MEKQLTALEAFADFLNWVKDSGKWDGLNKKERNRIITARRDRDGKRSLPLGVQRIKSILEEHAPDRYEFKESIILHE